MEDNMINMKQKMKSFIKDILPYKIVSYYTEKRLNLEIPSSDEPPLYNAHGQEVKTIFLKSDISRHWPYGFVTGQFPRYILWDRNNYGLKNHVYVHNKILHTIGRPVRKFALFIEAETIVPQDYMLFEKHKGLDKDFDIIFTDSVSLLNKYSNAAFIPASGVWYGTAFHGGSINKEQYKLKKKNVSIVSSRKMMCELHKFRIDVARYYKNSPLVDTFGTFDGGPYIKLAEALDKYRYSIIVENDISPYRFTEKILNCFASMTIPIYIGAAKIGDFFNLDGIIQVHKVDIDYINRLISNCHEKDYLSRLPAILDNFKKVNDFLCVEDYLYTHYKERFE
jgi:hypothetical protein